MSYCQGEITLRTVNWGRNLVNPCGGVLQFRQSKQTGVVSFLSLSTGQMGKARRHRQGFWHCRGHQPSDTGHHLAMYLQLQEQLSDWWVRQFLCQHLSADREEYLTRFFQCNTDLAFLWGGKASFFFFFRFPETVCVIRFKVDVKFLHEGFFLFGLVLFFQLRWSKWRRFLVNYRHFPVFWLPAEQMTTSKPFTRWPTWSTCGSPTSPSTTTSSSASAGASSTERPLK